ncbi:MAG TPA: hypothetical protein VFP65_13730 [Anaeromyxobacteraceae bacterium]|nr:hypothetical protein [Anaeromyxobacteraceae bacterium]
MRTLLAALAVLAAGCAHLKGDDTVCPEYRDLRCATAPECAMDAARGCQVCRCAPPAYVPPEAPRTH